MSSTISAVWAALTRPINVPWSLILCRRPSFAVVSLTPGFLAGACVLMTLPQPTSGAQQLRFLILGPLFALTLAATYLFGRNPRWKGWRVLLAILWAMAFPVWLPVLVQVVGVLFLAVGGPNSLASAISYMVLATIAAGALTGLIVAWAARDRDVFFWFLLISAVAAGAYTTDELVLRARHPRWAILGPSVWQIAVAGYLACNAWTVPPTTTMRCRKCGYDLMGLKGRFCPECGTATTPLSESTGS